MTKWIFDRGDRQTSDGRRILVLVVRAMLRAFSWSLSRVLSLGAAGQAFVVWAETWGSCVQTTDSPYSVFVLNPKTCLEVSLATVHCWLSNPAIALVSTSLLSNFEVSKGD